MSNAEESSRRSTAASARHSRRPRIPPHDAPAFPPDPSLVRILPAHLNAPSPYSVDDVSPLDGLQHESAVDSLSGPGIAPQDHPGHAAFGHPDATAEQAFEAQHYQHMPELGPHTHAYPPLPLEYRPPPTPGMPVLLDATAFRRAPKPFIPFPWILEGVPGLKGARTSHACEGCRRRKTKCSGEQPTCDRCERAGDECTYEARTYYRPPCRARKPKAAAGRMPQHFVFPAPPPLSYLPGLQGSMSFESAMSASSSLPSDGGHFDPGLVAHYDYPAYADHAAFERAHRLVPDHYSSGEPVVPFGISGDGTYVCYMPEPADGLQYGHGYSHPPAPPPPLAEELAHAQHLWLTHGRARTGEYQPVYHPHPHGVPPTPTDFLLRPASVSSPYPYSSDTDPVFFDGLSSGQNTPASMNDTPRPPPAPTHVATDDISDRSSFGSPGIRLPSLPPPEPQPAPSIAQPLRKKPVRSLLRTKVESPEHDGLPPDAFTIKREEPEVALPSQPPHAAPSHADAPGPLGPVLAPAPSHPVSPLPAFYHDGVGGNPSAEHGDGAYHPNTLQLNLGAVDTKHYPPGDYTLYQADHPQIPMSSHAVVHTSEGIYYSEDLAQVQMDVRQWIDQCAEVPPAY